MQAHRTSFRWSYCTGYVYITWRLYNVPVRRQDHRLDLRWPQTPGLTESVRSNPILAYHGQVLGHVDTRKISGTKLSSKFSGTRPNRNALKGNGARIQARERLLTPSELGDRAIRPIFYKIPLPLPVTQRYSIRGDLINPPKKSMGLRFL